MFKRKRLKLDKKLEWPHNIFKKCSRKKLLGKVECKSRGKDMQIKCKGKIARIIISAKGKFKTAPYKTKIDTL